MPDHTAPTEPSAARGRRNKLKPLEQAGGWLDPRERCFVDEYLKDLNVQRAALAAGYSATTAKRSYVWISDNPTKPHLKAAIDEALAERSRRTQVSADNVLEKWWTIATADARELIGFHYCACRYCYGHDHEYQWTTRRAFNEALAEAVEKETKLLPNDKGGFGYSVKREPNPDCPECNGVGIGRTVLKDTDNLSPAAAALYAGVIESSSGVKINMEDRAAALSNVARHLGMLDKLTIRGDEQNPLTMLISSLGASRIEPVRADPEHGEDAMPIGGHSFNAEHSDDE